MSITATNELLTPIDILQYHVIPLMILWTSCSAEAAPPVRLVRLWPDHFSSRPDYNITCSVVTHNLLIMQTRQWHLFLVLVVGLPLKLQWTTAAKVFSFPKRPFWYYESASSSLKIHAKIFFRASSGQIGASRLCATNGPYHFFYAAAAPAQCSWGCSIAHADCRTVAPLK